jgi:hypothetical protein
MGMEEVVELRCGWRTEALRVLESGVWQLNQLTPIQLLPMTRRPLPAQHLLILRLNLLSSLVFCWLRLSFAY